MRKWRRKWIISRNFGGTARKSIRGPGHNATEKIQRNNTKVVLHQLYQKAEKNKTLFMPLSNVVDQQSQSAITAGGLYVAWSGMTHQRNLSVTFLVWVNVVQNQCCEVAAEFCLWWTLQWNLKSLSFILWICKYIWQRTTCFPAVLKFVFIFLISQLVLAD